MRGKPGFDEVMIVNPSDPGDFPGQGARLMTYYGGVPAGFGYYGQPAAFGLTPNGYGYYGGYGEEPYLAEDMPYGETEPYGYYAEFPQMGAWAEAEPYGAYDPVGYFAEDYPVGWPGSAPALGYMAEAPEAYGYGPVGWYGAVPEMVGYGEYEPVAAYGPGYANVGEAYPEYGYYAEPNVDGYVREAPAPFNAGCPLPTNVAGFAEAQPLEGYVQPSTVNASCDRYTAQPGPETSVPETFKPLW